jgi:hypothetical protein
MTYGLSKPHLDYIGGRWWAQYRGWAACRDTMEAACSAAVKMVRLYGDAWK